jgi:hypothetical protein
MSDQEIEREPLTEDGMVAALLREREGYVVRGMAERIAAVDAELRRRGVEPPPLGPPAKQETKQETAQRAPRGRRAPGKSTT